MRSKSNKWRHVLGVGLDPAHSVTCVCLATMVCKHSRESDYKSLTVTELSLKQVSILCPMYLTTNQIVVVVACSSTVAATIPRIWKGTGSMRVERVYEILLSRTLSEARSDYMWESNRYKQTRLDELLKQSR
jgi:hypothetical protein